MIDTAMEGTPVPDEAATNAESEPNGDGDGPGEEVDETEENTAAAMEIDEAEAIKKKSAMESLGFIERDFATFRDRLFDDRLSQLSSEMALLEEHNTTHTDLLAMIQSIDARRDEKIAHEQFLVRFQTQALEKVAGADRSQIFSQFFQGVRSIREEKLEEVGEQWYKIQQDRRKTEGGVTDFAYQFSSRKSQQIAQQTAYNLEVSILAGVAKYVGFPAAPIIEGARPSELEEDLQNMGIKPHIRALTNHRHSGAFHTTVPVTGAQRAKPAEEQFLEQTPWANPQHPIHQHLQHAQRQAGRAGSPLSRNATAAAQIGPVPGRFSPNGSAQIYIPGTSLPGKAGRDLGVGAEKSRSPLSGMTVDKHGPTAALSTGGDDSTINNKASAASPLVIPPSQPSVSAGISTGRFA